MKYLCNFRRKLMRQKCIFCAFKLELYTSYLAKRTEAVNFINILSFKLTLTAFSIVTIQQKIKAQLESKEKHFCVKRC